MTGFATVRLLIVATLAFSASLALPAIAAPADDVPCLLSTVAESEVSKAFLVGPVHESAFMSVRLQRAAESRGAGRRAPACPRLRNVVTITDIRPGQSGYAYGQGWSAAQAAMDLRYYEPATSDPSVAPWDTTGVVAVRFRAYREGASTAIWCRLDTWSVSSAGAWRLLPTQPDCSGLPD